MSINAILAILSIILSITFIIIAFGFIDTEIAKGLSVFHLLSAPIIAILSTINYIMFQKKSNKTNKFEKIFKITSIFNIFPLAIELIAFGILGA